jgi:hypothetical protein
VRRRRLNDAGQRLFLMALSASPPCRGVMAAARPPSGTPTNFVSQPVNLIHLSRLMLAGRRKRNPPVMTRMLALLASAIGAVAVLLIANPADARGWYRVYPPSVRGHGWRETPTYAPDAPPPRSFYNNGFPDRQLDAR